MEFELRTCFWLNGSGFVFAMHPMMWHRLGALGRANSHPGRYPLDGQRGLVPKAQSNGQFVGMGFPTGGQVGFLPPQARQLLRDNPIALLLGGFPLSVIDKDVLQAVTPVYDVVDDATRFTLPLTRSPRSWLAQSCLGEFRGGALVRLELRSSGKRPLSVWKGWNGNWKGRSMTFETVKTGSVFGSPSEPVTLYSNSLVNGHKARLKTWPKSGMSRRGHASTRRSEERRVGK